MPFSAQISASSSLMVREASEMSVSPSQKRAKPSPVPGPETDTFTSARIEPSSMLPSQVPR